MFIDVYRDLWSKNRTAHQKSTDAFELLYFFETPWYFLWTNMVLSVETTGFLELHLICKQTYVIFLAMSFCNLFAYIQYHSLPNLIA